MNYINRKQKKRLMWADQIEASSLLSDKINLVGRHDHVRSLKRIQLDIHKSRNLYDSGWITMESNIEEFVLEIGEFPIEYLSGIRWAIIVDHAGMPNLYSHQMELVQVEDTADDKIKNVRLIYGIWIDDIDEANVYPAKVKLVWYLINPKLYA